MRRSAPLLLVLMISSLALMLAACAEPKTPQEVTQAFWQAVISHDAKAVVKYSTLSNPQDFDGFGLDWQSYTPSWGKVIIDGDAASIVTEFSQTNAGSAQRRKCVTYLVRRNAVWKVDYKLTGSDLHGGALGALVGQLNQLGNELSKSFDESTRELNLELERLSRKLRDMTDSYSAQASKILDKYADMLKDIMRQLSQSINRALQDKHNHPSDRDRQTLQEVAAELDSSSRQLNSATTDSVTESNTRMGLAQSQLGSVDSGISEDYKQQWQALVREFETAMHDMLNELAALGKSQHTE